MTMNLLAAFNWSDDNDTKTATAPPGFNWSDEAQPGAAAPQPRDYFHKEPRDYFHTEPPTVPKLVLDTNTLQPVVNKRRRVD